MTYYDEQLKNLQEQVARSRQLSAVLAELRGQRNELLEQVRALQAIMLDEQADVDRLEGRSLAAFFYNVIGKMDEQLTKERQDAYAARVKYDAAVRELEAAEADIRRCEAEFCQLRDCESRYKAMLREKADAIKSAGTGSAEALLRLEERAAFLENQQKELREAVSAGSAAYSTAQSVLSSLDSAEGWATYDLVGGGILADMAKHSHLDEAQSSIEHLQSQLRRFKTELADVTVQADIQVNVEGFLRFADYFFDDLFTDWTVMNQISQSKNQIQNTLSQIEGILSHLNSLLNGADRELGQTKDEIEKLVRNTSL